MTVDRRSNLLQQRHQLHGTAGCTNTTTTCKCTTTYTTTWLPTRCIFEAQPHSSSLQQQHYSMRPWGHPRGRWIRCRHDTRGAVETDVVGVSAAAAPTGRILCDMSASLPTCPSGLTDLLVLVHILLFGFGCCSRVFCFPGNNTKCTKHHHRQ